MLRSKQFFEQNIFTVEVEVTPHCNFTCEYCENKNTATFESFSSYNIDFNALHKFLLPYKGQCTVILNGGEPTLHPGLLSFCQQMKQASNIEVVLYTNFSQPEELYKQLMLCNVKICPTYHEEMCSIEQFASKLDSLDVSEVLVPCTQANIRSIDSISKAFKNVHLVLLENKDTSPADLCKLAKVDKSVLEQCKILRKAMQPRVCRASGKYLYINGDGSVHQCMFLGCTQPIGDIFSNDILSLSSAKTVCSNYCFYEF